MQTITVALDSVFIPYFQTDKEKQIHHPKLSVLETSRNYSKWRWKMWKKNRSYVCASFEKSWQVRAAATFSRLLLLWKSATGIAVLYCRWGTRILTVVGSDSILPYSFSEHRRILGMASEELARKLQSRLAATQETEPRPEREQSPVRPKPQEPEAACGDSSSELCVKLTRRLDINDGNAAPRPTRVFNPYTEFKEFSRKQIKDMETMFKR